MVAIRTFANNEGVFMKNSMMALVISLFSLGAFAQGTPSSQPAANVPAVQSTVQSTVASDKEVVKSNCSSEAKTAGCGDEAVGKGLLKCLHSYKKSHSGFKFSEGCQSSMKKLQSDKSMAKLEKNEKKDLSEKSNPVEKK